MEVRTEHKEMLIYQKRFETELKDNILKYWIDKGVEADGDGFYPAALLDGTPLTSANKTSVLNARILWTYAEAAIMYSSEEYTKIADRAYNVLINYFEDKEFGGYYMQLDSSNSVVEDTKHTYSQAFILYAFSKYYELTKREDVMAKIQEFFLFLEEKTYNDDGSAYIEAMTRDWKPQDENRMSDNNEPRTMNTHLHVMEAFCGIYRVWKDDRVKAKLREMILLHFEKMVRPSGHLGVFFDLKFNETKGSSEICSFGHDIEASWLLWEALEVLGDSDLMEMYQDICLDMADAVLKTAVDHDGGIFLESYRDGSHVRTNKHWWLQAEALVGFLNAYELTGDELYWDVVKQTWSFIDNYVIDHEQGEWFTKLNRAGVPFLVEPEDDPSPYYRNDCKIDPWKCPYHNGRAMMECIKRINHITSKK